MISDDSIAAHASHDSDSSCSFKRATCHSSGYSHTSDLAPANPRTLKATTLTRITKIRTILAIRMGLRCRLRHQSPQVRVRASVRWVCRVCGFRLRSV